MNSTPVSKTGIPSTLARLAISPVQASLRSAMVGSAKGGTNDVNRWGVKPPQTEKQTRTFVASGKKVRLTSSPSPRPLSDFAHHSMLLVLISTKATTGSGATARPCQSDRCVPRQLIGDCQVPDRDTGNLASPSNCILGSTVPVLTHPPPPLPRPACVACTPLPPGSPPPC